MIYAGFVMLPIPIIRRFTRTRWAPKAIEACLKESLCPSCGYSLAGSRLEEDSCAICAECGAAWYPWSPRAGR